MQLKEGTQLKNGKYKVKKVLGQGGFGITYLASMRERVKGDLGSFNTEVDVAVKEFFMKSSCTRDADATLVCTSEGAQVDLIERFKRRFVKEATMLASLDHPHIVPVTEVFEENNTVYYVMQYLDGGSLKKWVDRHGPMSEAQAKEYILQVASALDYLHCKKKACHFDVKPGNIMLNDAGKAVLIDFGISRQYAPDKDTSASAPVGITAGFSPLEQYQGSMPQFSPSSDVYSLACTLYYLITGTVPPDAPTILDRGLGNRPSSISPQTWEAISKAMKPARVERLQTIREFVDIIDNESTVVIPSTEDNEPAGAPAPQSRSWQLPVSHSTILAVLACLLGIIVVWVLYPRSKTVKDLLWTDSHQESYHYDGQVRKDKPHGEGVARYADGRVYEGEFHNGLKDGEARFTDRRHSVFTGVYAADTIQRGRLDYHDGTIYFEGDFVGDQPYDGTWYYTDGDKPFVHLNKGKEEPADD